MKFGLIKKGSIMLNIVVKGRVLDKAEVNGSDVVCAMMLLEVNTFAAGQAQTVTVEVWFPHFMKKRVAWFLATDVKYVMVIANCMTEVKSKVTKFQTPLVSLLAIDIDR